MKKLMILCFSLIVTLGQAQEAADLFRQTDYQYTWLGVDFSHVKLIGDFAEFGTAGDKSSVQVKKTYFPAWNNIVLKEADKYDVAGMLRKEKMEYDTDMITAINETASAEDMEVSNVPNYTKEDIQKFVNEYKPKKKDGIGIVFVAEALNKNKEEAYYHFVALDMKTNKILLHERLEGKPGGFGLRNYWARTIFEVIEDIKKDRYKAWKSTYASKK